MSQTTDTIVATICDALGRKTVAERLGVRPTAVSNAVTDGRFPARWFPVVRGMCEERGLDCPENAFNFKTPESVTTENAEAS